MKKLRKNKSKFLILTLVSTMFLISGCTSNQDVNDKEDNKTDNNVIEDNNMNNVITSDHITNDKVQEIYDIVKLEKFPAFSYPNYMQDGFINNLHNQIVIAMDDKKNLKLTYFSDEQMKYMNNGAYDNYYHHADLHLNNGYVSFDEINNQLYKIFNITINKSDLINLKYPHNMHLYFQFNFDSMSVYDEYINGFIPLQGRGGGDIGHYITKIYNYTEDSNKATVDTVIAYSAFCEDRDLNPLGCIYKIEAELYELSENNIKPLYENIDENSFEFTEENMDKFTKLRYTFNKREDGTYYFANVKVID